METEQIQPKLQEAQKALEKALDEACGVDVTQVDTGELIRIEETLVLASKAAKEAVSMRLRLRSQRGGAPRSAKSSGEAADEADVIKRRVLEDIRGTRWFAFAVQPSSAGLEHGGLPASFRKGWLVFESANELRRVAPIPQNWEEMPSDELLLLCYRAPSSPRRTNSADAKEDPARPAPT